MLVGKILKNKNKLIPALILAAIVAVGLFFAASPLLAQTDNFNTFRTAAGAGNQTDLITFIGRIVQVLLGLLGVLAVILLIYAGFFWMTAAGDPAKIAKAKKIIVGTIIGLIIIFSSFAIVSFVIYYFGGATGAPGAPCDVNGSSQECLTTDICSGRQICYAGRWSACIKYDPGCPDDLFYRSQYSNFRGFSDPVAFPHWTRFKNLYHGFKGTVQLPTSTSLEVYGYAHDRYKEISRMEFFTSSTSRYDKMGDFVNVTSSIQTISGFFFNVSDQATTTWDTRAYLGGATTSIFIRVFNSLDTRFFDSGEITARFWPAHCFNGIKDEDELDIDCGNSCFNCAGQSCQRPELAACDDSNCASGKCLDSCLCAGNPIIDYISPATDALDNTDFDVPSTTDDDIANGAPGSFITIWGRQFGDAPGRVFFRDQAGKSYDAPTFLSPNCTGTWSNNQIIAEVPGALVAGTGGKNLLSNSGFETPLSSTDWNWIRNLSKYGPDGHNANYSSIADFLRRSSVPDNDPVPPNSGRYKLKIDVDSARSDGYITLLYSGGGISLTQGKKYVLSAYVYVPAPNNLDKVYIDLNQAASNTIDICPGMTPRADCDNSNFPTKTYEWQRIQLVFTVSSTNATVSLAPRLVVLANTETRGESVYFDDIQLEEIPSTATGPTPYETSVFQLGDYQVEVVNTDTNLTSNQRLFRVNDIVRPGICNMVPRYGIAPATTTVYGNKFPAANPREVFWEVYNRYFQTPGGWMVSSTAVVENITSTAATDWTDSSVIDTPPENKRGRAGVRVYNGAQYSNYFSFLISAGGLGDACGYSSVACNEDNSTCQSGYDCQYCQKTSSTLANYDANCDLGKNCTCQPPPTYCVPGTVSTTPDRKVATCTPDALFANCGGFYICNASSTGFTCVPDPKDKDCPNYPTKDNATQSIYSYAFTAIKIGGEGVPCGYDAWGECDINGCEGKGLVCDIIGSSEQWLEIYNPTPNPANLARAELRIFVNPFTAIGGLTSYFNFKLNTAAWDYVAGNLSSDSYGISTYGQGMEFINAGDFQSINHTIDPAEGTISLWVRPKARPTAGNQIAPIFYACDGSACHTADGLGGAPNQNELHLHYESDGKFGFYFGDGTHVHSLTSLSSYALDTWYSLTVAYKNGEYYRLYVNGEKVAEQNGEAVVLGSNFFPNAILGKAQDGARHFTGTIRELAMYNRAISDQEAKSIYQGSNNFLQVALSELGTIAGRGYLAIDSSTTDFALPYQSALVALFDPTNASPLLDSVIYGPTTIHAPPKKSIGREEDGLDTGSPSDWQVFSAPSRGATNGAVAASAPDHLVINELMPATPPCTCVLGQPCKPGQTDTRSCPPLGQCQQMKSCNASGYWSECVLAKPNCIPYPYYGNAAQSIFAWAFVASLGNGTDEPFVIEDCSRDTDCTGQPLGSPSPWFEGIAATENGAYVGWTSNTNPFITHEKACLDSLITARFNVKMFEDSFANKIKIYECTDQTKDHCTLYADTNYSYSIDADNNSLEDDILTITSTVNLVANKWYKVLLLNDIKSDFNIPLRREREKVASRQCEVGGYNSTTIAYCWNFQTRSNAAVDGPLQCKVGCVECQPNPSTAWWYMYQTRHRATPVSDDNVCLALNASRFAFDWVEKEYDDDPLDPQNSEDIADDDNWILRSSNQYATVLATAVDNTTSTALRETIFNNPDFVRISATERRSQKTGYCKLRNDFTNPRVMENVGCREGTTQSPSPYKGWKDACLNAMISARFSHNMVNSSIFIGANDTTYSGTDSDTIIIQRCDDPSLVTSTKLNGCTDFDFSSGIIFPYSHSDLTLEQMQNAGANGADDPEGFVINPGDATPGIPGSTLQLGHWYRVIIRGGQQGVRGTTGTTETAYGLLVTPGLTFDYNFSDHTNGSGDGELDYMWYFKVTDAKELCPIDSVNVSPYMKFFRLVSENSLYNAFPQAANCNILDGNSYTWAWRSLIELTDDTQEEYGAAGASGAGVAGICSSAAANYSAACASTSSMVRVFGLSDGLVNIKARASSTRDEGAPWNDPAAGDKWGRGILQVGYGNLMVTNYGPRSTVCLNPNYFTKFSTEVKTSTFSLNTNVKLYQCYEGDAYYTFDSTTTDSAGNISLTPNVVPTYSSGKFGQALDFNGSDVKYVSSSNAFFRTNNSFTVSVWVNKRSNNPAGTGRVVASVYKSVDATDHGGWLLGQASDDGTLDKESMNFFVAGTDNIMYKAGYKYYLRSFRNKWTHVVGIYNRDNNRVKLFINGREVSSSPVAVGITIDYDTDPSLLIGWKPLSNFDGQIDDFRFYSKALSAGEVKRLYESGADGCPFVSTTDALHLDFFPSPAAYYSKQFFMSSTDPLIAGNNYRMVIKGGAGGVKAWNGQALNNKDLNYKLSATPPAGEECETSTYPWNTVLVGNRNVCSSSACVIDPNINLCGTIYSQCANNPGLLVYLRFNGRPFNSTGNAGIYVTNGNDATYTPAGKFGQALDLTGSYLLSLNNPTVGPRLNVTSSFTFSAWINPRGSGDDAQPFYTDVDGDNRGTFVAYNKTNKTFRFNFNSGVSYYSVITEHNIATDNKWHFLAGTFENGELKLYVDDHQPLVTNTPAGSYTRDFIGSTIGATPDGGNKFNGALDEVRIYNRALSAQEIKTLREKTDWDLAIYCDAYCQNGGNINTSACGDNIVQVNEECDDGNSKSGDGCSNYCLMEGASDQWNSVCGNGIIETGELCDDGNTISGDNCSSACLYDAASSTLRKLSSEPGSPICGNGTVEKGEECDDGNTESNDGCRGPGLGSAGCVFEGSKNLAVCGNGIVEPGQFDSFSWAFKAGDRVCQPAQIVMNPCINGIWRFIFDTETISSTITIYKKMVADNTPLGACETLALKPKSNNFFVAAFSKIKEVVLKLLGFKQAIAAAEKWCPISEVTYDSTVFDAISNGFYNDKYKKIYTDGVNPNNMEIIGYTDNDDSAVINYINGANWTGDGEYRAKVWVEDTGGASRPAQNSVRMFADACQLKGIQAEIWPRGETKNDDAFFCAGNNCGSDTADNDKKTHGDEYDDDMSAVWTKINSNYDLPSTSTNEYLAGNQHVYRLWAYGDYNYLLKSTFQKKIVNLDATDVTSTDLQINSTTTDYTGDLWVTGGVRNGEDALAVTSTGTGGTGVVASTIMIRTFLCKNPWPDAANFPYRDNRAACNSGVGTCFQTNFLTYYCRDAGDATRCDGGSNDGKVCTKASDCPGSGAACQLYTADDLPALPTSDANVRIMKGNTAFEDCPNLPSDFVPRFGFYHAFGGGRINLWDNQGNIYFEAGTIWRKMPMSALSVNGLPSGFRPIIGYYHEYGAGTTGGRINLWDASGQLYVGRNEMCGAAPCDKWYAGNDSRHNTLNNLPSGFIPNIGYYNNIDDEIYLWSGRTIYRGKGATVGGDGLITYTLVTTSPAGLPNNYYPTVGYYFNNVHYIWNEAGVSYKSTNIAVGWVPTDAAHLTGLPANFRPKAGYADLLSTPNKIVLWNGQRAFSLSIGGTAFIEENYFNNNCDINIKEFFFNTSTAAGGTIGLGIKIVSNGNHFSPLYWYQTKFAKNRQGSPKAISVGGYPGILEGRTAYVDAVNYDTTTAKVFTNMYIMSYDQDLGVEGGSIFSQMVNNWEFNRAIATTDTGGRCSDFSGGIIPADYSCGSDWSCLRFATSSPYYCTSDRAKMARDARRVSDIQDINVLMKKYYDQSRCSNDFLRLCTDSDQCYGGGYCGRFYPDLKSGTYLAGRSLSVWPSWLSNLGNSLGTALPVDPINKLIGCTTDPAGATNSLTCWNETDKRMACPTGRYVYSYYDQSNFSFPRLSIVSEYDATKWSPAWTKVDFLRANPFSYYYFTNTCSSTP